MSGGGHEQAGTRRGAIAERQAAVRAEHELGADDRATVLGRRSVGMNQVTAEQRAEAEKAAAERKGPSAGELADFTLGLAELAAAPPPEQDEEAERDAERDVARDAAIREEVEVEVDGEPDPDDDPRQQARRRARHLDGKKTADVGGGGGEDEDGQATPPAPVIPTRSGLGFVPVIRVVPRKRPLLAQLPALLALADELDLLSPYLAGRAEAAVLSATSADYSRLHYAAGRVGSDVSAVFVLKALLVGRSPRALPAFAEELIELGEGEVLGRFRARVPDAGLPEPEEDADLPTLRRFYDPLAALGLDPGEDDDERAEAEPPVPRWLRGVPRAPLDLCLLAHDLALRGDLDPEEDTRHGASDALTRACEPHAAAHPALRRWMLALAARATSREALLGARDAQLLARAEMAIPWQPAGQEL